MPPKRRQRQAGMLNHPRRRPAFTSGQAASIFGAA